MNASPPRRPSTAYRYLFVLCLGLLIGLIATVMVGRALQARRGPRVAGAGGSVQAQQGRVGPPGAAGGPWREHSQTR